MFTSAYLSIYMYLAHGVPAPVRDVRVQDSLVDIYIYTYV